MNYAQLTKAIQGYVQNDFPDTFGDYTTEEQLADFVRQAERRIYNMVQLPAQRKNVTGNVTNGNRYLTLPDDWIATYSIAVMDAPSGGYAFLLIKDVNFVREAFPYPAAIGTPKYYAVFDQNTLLLGPTPDDSYQVEMHYFAYPTSITEAGTSWIGDNAETVLLYGSLLEAYTFMKGEQDVMAMYQSRYDEALMQLKRVADGQERQDAYRAGQARVPVK